MPCVIAVDVSSYAVSLCHVLHAGKRKAREVEVGFKDTALHGNGTGAGKPAATPAGNEHDLALHGGAEGALPEDVEQQEDKQGK